ncbi:TrkH family potassium uptake protein [Salegentibacter chungangensis]|uniref:TrkH family potassium uptake protein n=1 Tax=Salegentibacter chungangensis TaxID=1335724 RepID=A0ABW3NV93_9FLAO
MGKFQLKDIWSNPSLLTAIRKFSFWLSFITAIILIYDVGFDQTPSLNQSLKDFYFLVLFIGIPSILIRYFAQKEKLGLKVKIFDTILFILFSLILIIHIDFIWKLLPLPDFFNKMAWVYLALSLYFIRELSVININFDRDYLNPAQLFISSFIFIILAGTALLLLPNATHAGISLLDALFTATSAVCVTGLIVVDTGSYFTEFGQIIILILIQLGGLGIMTFASYFSYFFRGKTSYENQLMLKDITNSEKIGEVFNVLKKIILLTFAIELIGGVFIFLSLEKSVIPEFGERLFFSVFHTVSGFCNAGFSTLQHSLYEPAFRFNYPLQLIISVLFILGGLGFPIIFNLSKYLKYLVKNKVLRIKQGERALHDPWVININTRIVIITSIILTSVGTVIFYVFEYNNTLAGHSSLGKVVSAFFSASTPRTAGFNVVETSGLHFSTIMMIFFLMWVGASPVSTGGGIKTSTIAIATFNFFSLARGKDRIEIYKREIAQISIRRAFSIISLSLAVIGMAIFMIAAFDSDKSLLSIAFECFSAYSTVGLSLGITSNLSSASKLVLICTMFIGRVSMLTILIALLRRVKHLNYQYPKEEILIN